MHGLIIKKLINLIFPSHCLYCSKIINEDGLFCQECWPKLQFITKPQCPICAFPYEVDIPNMNPLCAKCIAKKPSFDRTITVYSYNYIIKKIISDLKYRDNSFLIKKISQILLPHLQQQIKKDDILIAVPLHKNKLKQRKFNQTTQICQELIKKLPEKPLFYHDLLFRSKDTKPQVSLKKEERSKNLKKAFIINKKYYPLIKDRRVFIFDDVITTGATVESCAKAIKRKEAKEIIIISLAKTSF